MSLESEQLASMGPPIYIGGNKEDPSTVVMEEPAASMGPPIYIGGNFPQKERPETPQPSFNGATDLHRWKLKRSETHGNAKKRLQWGHRFTSVETTQKSIQKVFGEVLQWGHRFTSVETEGVAEIWKKPSVASMGPPIYIGGNGTRRGAGRCWRTRLQWGHRFTSVETYIMGGAVKKTPSLQWGHRFTSVETWNRPFNSVFGVFGFNGATDLHRWKPRLTSWPPSRSAPLQWGHRFTSVETSKDYLQR